ncbi:MAG TPA: SBBP repeat-containing protein [Bacteroidota bacterium]|nr:SBBP repeat-containing protein [Bacteroidota bacterium]
MDPGTGHDEASALTADSAGNIYVTGASLGSGTSRDVVTIKYNAQGDSQWVACYEGAPNEDDTPYAIAIDSRGNVYVAGTSYSGTVSTATVIKYLQRSVLDVVVEDGSPSRFSLSQNYPNPFNPSTVIRYALPLRSRVILSVFNALGQQVAVLQDGEQAAGYYEVQFDGRHLSSGVYFCRMQAGSFVQTRTLVLLR